MPNFSHSAGVQLQMWSFLRGDNQYWCLTSVDAGGFTWYQFLSFNSLSPSMCLAENGIVNGSAAVQTNCNINSNAQLWRENTRPGKLGWELINRASGKCLDIANLNQGDGALLQIWSCSNAWNQRWTHTS